MYFLISFPRSKMSLFYSFESRIFIASINLCQMHFHGKKAERSDNIWKSLKATAATTSFSKCARCQISVKSQQIWQNTNEVVDKQILTHKGTIFRNKRFMPDKNDLAKCFKNQNLPYSWNKKIPSHLNFSFSSISFSPD